ncbi:hypothetical protein [Borreliella kurtenbachii]|uniref:hypothetical protein n=1 Tax=Borreliella kurtenbachii TaxID=1196056 RepID=UPI003462D09B
MKNIFAYLELNAIEICVLRDKKKLIYKFYESILYIENDVGLYEAGKKKYLIFMVEI